MTATAVILKTGQETLEEAEGVQRREEEEEVTAAGGEKRK